MKRIVYISRSLLSGDFSEISRELRELTTLSKANNAELGITGAILFMDNHFCQTIEGPAGVIDELMAKISRDPRHTDVEILVNEPITESMFSNWEMANLGIIQDPPEYQLNTILGHTNEAGATSRRRAVRLIHLMESKLREAS